MFRKYTKWIPLGEFTFSNKQYVVMVRGNKKTGMLYFKSCRVNKSFYDLCYPVGKLPVDVSAQWDKMQQMVN